MRQNVAPKKREVGREGSDFLWITERKLYGWKKSHKEAETDQVRQFKQVQEENVQLNRLMAKLTLDKTLLHGRAGESGRR